MRYWAEVSSVIWLGLTYCLTLSRLWIISMATPGRLLLWAHLKPQLLRQAWIQKTRQALDKPRLAALAFFLQEKKPFECSLNHRCKLFMRCYNFKAYSGSCITLWFPINIRLSNMNIIPSLCIRFREAILSKCLCKQPTWLLQQRHLLLV